MKTMKDFLALARKFGYEEVEKTGMPLKLHVDLACQIGKRLAESLGANIEIVEIGTLLMDCMIGQAIKQGKLSEHIQMSTEKADELLAQSNLSSKDKENIRHCVLEHHGADKFYSLESEICCNADCYRFTSVKGFSYAVRYMRDMPFADMVNLLENKVAEKWGLVSLDICRKELLPQHSILESFLKELKS